ncbi:MAG: excinuclease ABC subunit UvrB [Phycisphaerales bacterium]|nr:excinuclease ABC subunit UvrB [Phycisphaerales bacterium]
MGRADGRFELTTDLKPTGDQPEAIEGLVRAVDAGRPHVCLLGATGTGKTFTMAHLIQRVQRPTLVLSHNKTLAAQLYEELKELFPRNAVSYFVSYYDYYQPEAYIPARDIYIEKDASRNDDLDRLRLAATSQLLSRKDAIVVASVSCIFGLGSPEAYSNKVITIQVGQTIDRRQFLLGLADMQYQRADIDFKRGTFRVRGDVIDLYPAYEQFAVRIELFGDDIESITLIDATSGEVLAEEKLFHIFPAVHYVMPEDTRNQAIEQIKADLDTRVMQLRTEGKLLEAQRLLARTKYDIEMIEEVGYCSGIENYSRYFDGRKPGEPPWTLLDYFRIASERRRDAGVDASTGPGWMMLIDESHVTMPQVRAMYEGDRQRKTVLVEHGFRLPAALDNRPLKFEEFEQVVPQRVYVSATPGPYELERTGGEVIEQVIRPTGLLDPVIHVRPADGQVGDLVQECEARVKRGERCLVTALTKRLCEDLTNYLDRVGMKVRYLHSEIDTLDRLEILRDLRLGDFDVLVGVNLLREGLDLPEVSLVCILDADKAGFLRGETSLVQTIGRAARNVNGTVIMYADAMTPAMKASIEETERRRAKQEQYNIAHNITPETIVKGIRRGIEEELKATRQARRAVQASEPEFAAQELIELLEEEMLKAAQGLEFEKAADLRDQVNEIKNSPELLSEGRMIRLSELRAGGGASSNGRTSSKSRKPGQAGSKASTAKAARSAARRAKKRGAKEK